MMWLLLAAHLAGMAAAGLAGSRGMRSALLVAALPPALTAVWAIANLARGVRARTAELTWVDGLDLTVRFRSDSLAVLMTVLVSGIGALVFVFASGYFEPNAAGARRFPVSLLAFSTSMLGLVWADSVWTFFVFWELTSITSFLLVGHKNVDGVVRAAARRALLITGTGGLALLAGLLVLAREAGSTTFGDLRPVSGSAASLAAVLLLVGAATKSAQVPFHVWLPGAMAAPTPVSAYLHSATMVKAGVLLVALVGPFMAAVDAWTVTGLAFGVASALWGAVGALRHRDAKLILAWGTISQLGILITLLSLGTAKATFAALSILVAHALFKATLFLAVGEIDARTGTRDIAELGGLTRTMPLTFAIALLAGLSMAGAPPLVGFAAKEAAVEAALATTGLERLAALTAVVGGSVLTVAYTVRLLIGLFGRGPATPVSGPRLARALPAAALGLGGLVGFAFLGAVSRVVRDAAVELRPDAARYALVRFPGLTQAFVISLSVLAAGAALGGWLARRAQATPPAAVGARAADRLIDGVLGVAPRLIARIQHGSLPVYVASMGAVAAAAGAVFLADFRTSHLVWWDSALQPILAVTVVGVAAAGAAVRSRLGAALSLGAVGVGVSGLFVVHGAPDLALTQLLVETVIVVGFVVGLGHLTRRFPEVGGSWRTARAAIALAGGVTVTAALAAAGARPVGTAPIDALRTEGVAEGGGKNLVNVILTDVRGLDTLGEVVVLATVAVGILALAQVRRQERSA